MLQSLTIRNLAIVENLEVEFGPALNVITGETGAGKSILATALGLVLGERADKTMIRTGESKCQVDAIFQLARMTDLAALLDDLGLPPCEDGQLIVRRTIVATGAGKSLVNDGVTTLQGLTRIGDLLVDQHGPHDHQSLLNRDFQLDLLDAYGHLRGKRDAYAELYRRRLELLAQRREIDTDDADVRQQIDMLAYQVKEIEAAGLSIADSETLAERHARAANAQEVVALAGGACQALTEDESSAYECVTAAQRALAELARITAEAEAWRVEAAEIALRIQALSNTIGTACNDVEVNPDEMRELEARMSLIHNLKRKYGGSIESVIETLARARTRLADLEGRGERLAAIDAALETNDVSLRKAGGELRKARRKSAATLAEAVTTELQDLGFAQGRFDVALTDGDPRPSGLDEVDFGFAPNVGEAMRPLRSIASSGEISRVMLATKAVLAMHDRIPVLVFDEIDANVGGEMGHAIGCKLAAVAANRQVLCITHLPQVAVHGRTHLVVAKQVEAGRTRTAIQRVTGPNRDEEVARMLGGKDQTSVTLKHARELLRKHA